MNTIIATLAPLQGLKVLDLSRILAGPYAAMVLGDLGANVIKVERSEKGDETRGWGPPFDQSGESAYYLSINRNKLGIALDFDKPADTQVLRKLIAEADVVLDNFLPRILSKRRINAPALLARNPGLIWCTITGFGPNSARPSYDFVVQAESGWMAITGEPEGDPLKTGVALADLIAGKDAVAAILAALIRKGRGPVPPEDRRIWISLSHSATAALINVAQNALVSGKEARRWGNAHPNLVPYQTFRASDRLIVVAVGSDSQWKSCANVLGLSKLAQHPSLATNSGRLKNRSKLVSQLQAVIAKRPASHWIQVLERVGVPCGVVRTVLEALKDVDASPLHGIASPIPGTVRLPPPRLDQHGSRIRADGWKVFDSV
ncbi:MAG: CoA transferase [Gemmatimonadaceae bacterium]|nr:CoA transferase [Gemmatimonadaceae bacterium]